MNEYDDEAELVNYVWDQCAKFFTPIEAKASWAVFADAKARMGHEQVANFIWKRHGLADDPEVVAALADGVEAFRRRVARRILRDHGHELIVNRCPKCNRVARTSRARQCFWCGFDWHDAPVERAE